MSGVELKVVLVGDDQRQQDAFQRPESSATSAQPSGQQSTTQPDGDDSAATEEAVRQLNEFLRNSPDATHMLDGSQDIVVQSLVTLVDLVSQVVAKIQKGGGGGGSKKTEASPKADSWIADLIELAQNNRVGRTVTRAAKSARTMANRAMKSGLGQRFLKSKVGRGLARAGSGIAAKLGFSGGTAAAGTGGAEAAGTAAVAGGTVTIAAAAVAAGLAAAAVSVKLFVDAVERASQELMDVSPHLSAAQAEHEMRREAQRIERAQKVGPEFAQMMSAQNRLSESMYEVQTKIYELMAKLAPSVETMIDGVTVLVRLGQVNIDAVELAAAQVLVGMAQLTPWTNADDRVANALLNKELADLMKSMGDLGSALGEFMQTGGGAHTGLDPLFQQILTMPGPGQAPMPPGQGFGGGGIN